MEFCINFYLILGINIIYRIQAAPYYDQNPPVNSYQSNVIPTTNTESPKIIQPDLNQFEKQDCKTQTEIPPDVNDFLDKKPPTTEKQIYETKGIFEGDMTGLDVLVDGQNKQIIVPSDITAETLRWPNKIIPYAFYEKTDFKTISVVVEAMRDMETKTCIRFVPRTYEDDYLKISPGVSCASDVGYTKGEHLLSVNPGCLDDYGAIQHEFMHALGIIHEQARPDRDPFIFVNFSNIFPDIGSQAQFYKFSNPSLMDLGIPYDYNSIMHYAMDAFAVNRNFPSIMPKQKGQLIGNRVEMSPLDIKRINRLYRCDDNPLDEQKNPIPEAANKKYFSTWTDFAKLCDGNKDTPEGWDEDADVCVRMCRILDSPKLGSDGHNLFTRKSTKQCMHKRQLCDGTGDASYDLMQQPETCRKYCRFGGYVSMPKSGQCIHYSKLCNGKKDTASGEDEQQDVCRSLCQSADTGFKGELFNSEEAGGRCIKKAWLCDGKHRGPMGDADYCAKYCKGGGFFPVGDRKQCIHWRKLCDGHVDTVSGLDADLDTCQQLCKAASAEVGDELFNLPTTEQCVSKRWLCDGTQHDKDDVMEGDAFCRQNCRGGGFVPTKDNAQCFHLTDLCDGKQDVRNGWDENPANCQKYCKPTKDWPPAGMELRLNEETNRCQLLDQSGRSVSGGQGLEDQVSTGFGGDVNSLSNIGLARFPDLPPNTTVPISTNPNPSKISTAAVFNVSDSAVTNPVAIPKDGGTNKYLNFLFGKAEPTAIAGDQFEISFENNTHELLKCPKGKVIETRTADYSGGGCPAVSVREKLINKCDYLPVCGYIARDVTADENCSGRHLVVRYSCTEPKFTFRTDPSNTLCSHESDKNATLTVQCNASAETLMP